MIAKLEALSIAELQEAINRLIAANAALEQQLLLLRPMPPRAEEEEGADAEGEEADESDDGGGEGDEGEEGEGDESNTASRDESASDVKGDEGEESEDGEGGEEGDEADESDNSKGEGDESDTASRDENELDAEGDEDDESEDDEEGEEGDEADESDDSEGEGDKGDDESDENELDAEGDEGDESEEDAASRDESTSDAEGEEGEGDEGEEGDESNEGEEDSEGDKAGSGASPDSDDAPFVDDDMDIDEDELDAFMRQFENEAALVVRSAIDRDNSFERLGIALHEALKPGVEHVQQVARNLKRGLPQAHGVRLPKRNASVIDPYWPRARAIAHRLAIELDDIRSAARKRRERYLDEGQFDRGRLVAAYTGERNVRYQETQMDDTALAASLLVDLSGSMGRQKSSGQLYTGVAAISTTMTELQMPHEVRGFDEQNFQFKAMHDQTFEPERAACLFSSGGGGTSMSASAELSATSLLGRPERNKLLIGLTDGELGDHDETQTTLELARKKGALTFGVFLGQPSPSAILKLDELYGQTHGQRNWVAIGNLDDFPKRVGKRIADIFNALD